MRSISGRDTRAYFATRNAQQNAAYEREERGLGGRIAGLGVAALLLGGAILAFAIPADCETPAGGWISGARQAVKCSAPEPVAAAPVAKPMVVAVAEPVAEPEPVVEPAPPVVEEPPASPPPGPVRARWFDSMSAERAPYWSYASTSKLNNGSAWLGGQGAVCEADVVVAVGSASSDNATGRNDALAAERAAMLADMVREMCGAGVEVLSLGLGGHTGPDDRDAQRRPMLVAFNRENGPVTSEEMADRLCAAASNDPVQAVAELSAYSAFRTEGSCALEMRIRLRGPARG